MKKILFIALILSLSTLNVFAEELPVNTFTSDDSIQLNGYLEYDEEPQETIYLEEQPESTQNTIYLKSTDFNNVNIKLPEKIGSKSLPASDKKMPQFDKLNQLQAASRFSTQEYNIAPVSGKYSGQSGNVTFGTTYDSSLDSAQSSYSTGLFTRYDGKHFAVTTQYSKSTKSGYDGYSDKVFLAPELKLTKRLSILDVVQSDISQTNKKNEIILRYKAPFKKYAEDVQFELGAGQTFRESDYINSSVKFSTRFKL